MRDDPTNHVQVFDSRMNRLLSLKGVRDPIWVSPDEIAVAGEDGLLCIDTDTRATRRIGPVGLGQLGPWPSHLSLSPDGKSLAFVHGDALWRIDLDGSRLTQLTKQHAGHSWSAWSPDGTQLAVVHGGSCSSGGTSVRVISARKPDQDMEKADLVWVPSKLRTRIRTCSRLYWLR